MNTLLNSIRNNTPNAITCLNLLSGSLACIAAFKGYETVAGKLNGFEMAYVFIAMAAVFDFCDGMVARLLHATSPLGKQLDSLSDLVSFGLAPALILFNIMATLCPSSPARYLVLLLPIAGACRLARFNIATNQATTFTGLAIPANAIFWIGFTSWYSSTSLAINPWLVVLVVILMSWLMVSDLRMFSLKVHDFSLKHNWYRYLLIAACVLLVASLGLLGLAWTIVLYALLCIFVRTDGANA